MDKLIIEHNERLHFYKAYCSEGHYITSFNEGVDDISTFSAIKAIYCPDTTDIEAIYHCINEEKFNELTSRKAEAKLIEQEDYEVSIIWNESESVEDFVEALEEKFGDNFDKIDKYLEMYLENNETNED